MDYGIQLGVVSFAEVLVVVRYFGVEGPATAYSRTHPIGEAFESWVEAIRISADGAAAVQHVCFRAKTDDATNQRIIDNVNASERSSSRTQS